MTRRRPTRERDLASFGRRTPRFDFVALRREIEAREKITFFLSGLKRSTHAKVLEFKGH